MTKTWAWAALTLALGCNKGAQQQAPAASSAAASGASATATATGGPAAATLGANGCLVNFDYLVPPQRYGDSDLIRAIVVDGAQVYFRNLHEVFRVPLAG